MAAAVSPSTALESIWRYDAARTLIPARFIGFSPQFPQASDLATVNRLDAVFICMREAGTLTRPVPASTTGMGREPVVVQALDAIPESAIIRSSILVSFWPGTSAAERARVHAATGGIVIREDFESEALNVTHVAVPPSVDEKTLARRYRAQPSVRYAEVRVQPVPASTSQATL